MARRIRSPWVLLAFSTSVAVAAFTAVVAFGAPPKIFVPASYATAAIAAFASHWARRRIGER